MDKTILLTYDYEMFFKKVGTVEKCLIQPVNVLKELFAKQHIQATFFIDVLYLQFLLDNKDVFLRDYNSIIMQLKGLLADGHRIELHLHPHWLDTKYNSRTGEITNDYTHYRLETLSDKVIMMLFMDGVAALENIAYSEDHHYHVKAFRAGGWCVQPFDKLQKAFLSSGLEIDSSLAYGMHDHTPTHVYDFSSMPEKSIYKFTHNPNIEEPTGAFWEIPISTYNTNPWEKIRKRVQYFRNKKDIKVYGDGYGMQVSKMTLARKLFETRTMFTTDGVFDVKHAQRYLKDYESPIVTYISHPKNLTTISLEFLSGIDREIYRFRTLQDLIS